MRFDNSDSENEANEAMDKAGSPRRSRSGSRSSRSRSGSGSRSSRSRSNSPNLQIASDGSRPASRASRPSRSRSRSGSGSRKSRSRTPSRSRSGSRSKSAQSNASNRSKSGSRSRSGSPASRRTSKSRSRSRSRSKSAGSRSGSGSPVQPEKKKKRTISSSDEGGGGAAGGSGSEKGSPKKRKVNALIDSDSDGDGEKKDGEGAAKSDALFGDADDISSDEEEGGRKSATPKRASGSDDDVRRGSDYNDDEDNVRRGSDDEGGRQEKAKEPEPEPIPETRIDVEIPRIVSDLGRDLHFVILPNFLSVETRPFDQETYEDEVDEEETLDEEGRQRVKLKVSNTLRWREYIDDDGIPQKESNARMVKWSDGSMSLHLGNEIFDVYKQPLQGDHNHLFVRQGTGLQGQTVFRTKLTFRPHSTDSFTHKKMTMSLADRMQKTSGIKILTQVGPDPDQDRRYNLKKEEEKLRMAMRAKSSGGSWKPKRAPGAMGGAYRDQDDQGSDDEGAISIAAIKNKYKKGAQQSASAANTSANSAIYSTDESEGSDFEARPKKNIDRQKGLKALNDSDESGSGEGTPPRRNRIEDDDDDDDDE